MNIDGKSIQENFRKIETLQKLKSLKRKKKFNIVTPDLFYADDNALCYKRLSTMFSISDTVKNHKIVKTHSNLDYISLHIRLGDKHMEDKSLNRNDDRNYKENLVIEFLESNKDKIILLFCDNQMYKEELKQKYKNVLTTSAKVVHFNSRGTTEEEVLHTVIEFYLLSKSKKIYAACNSGFSYIASFYGNVPYVLLDTSEKQDYLYNKCIV